MGLFSWLFGTGQQASYTTRPALAWEGSGDFDHEIVGESHYQDVLDAICGGKNEDGHEHECRAALIPEPNNPYDENAVAIHIRGRKIGHLSRDDALSYRRALHRLGISGRQVECDAIIVGGWSRGRGNSGHYGVKLDIVVPYRLTD